MIDSTPGAFEAVLTELTSIVETMEAGELSLEHALQYFERGVKLTRDCQQAISRAQQQVSILIAETELQSFNENDILNER